MKKLLASLLLSLAGLAAHASTVTVSWTNPTQYTDGSALAASDITQTRVEYGTCSGALFGSKLGQFTVAGNGTSGTSPQLAPGTYCFQAFTTAAGVESAASVAVSGVVPQPAPKPPVLKTTVAIAYAPVQGSFGLAQVRAVGLVAIGTPCDASKNYAGVYYGIPRSAVKPFQPGLAVPLQVYGKCSPS